MPRSDQTAPSEAEIKRERDALELRRAGMTYDAIAAQVGYANKGGAYKAVRRALRRTLQEPADELRTLELDRLERLQVAVWPKAMRGDVAAVDRVLRISERRSRLMGLDLPTLSEMDRTAALREIGQQYGSAVAGVLRLALADLGHDMADPAVLQVVSSRLLELRGNEEAAS